MCKWMNKWINKWKVEQVKDVTILWSGVKMEYIHLRVALQREIYIFALLWKSNFDILNSFNDHSILLWFIKLKGLILGGVLRSERDFFGLRISMTFDLFRLQVMKFWTCDLVFRSDKVTPIIVSRKIFLYEGSAR